MANIKKTKNGKTTIKLKSEDTAIVFGTTGINFVLSDRVKKYIKGELDSEDITDAEWLAADYYYRILMESQEEDDEQAVSNPYCDIKLVNDSGEEGTITPEEALKRREGMVPLGQYLMCPEHGGPFEPEGCPCYVDGELKA